MNKIKAKKIGKIVLNVFLYIFLAICIVAVFVAVCAKRDTDGAVNIFGHQMRIVTSESMEKCESTDVSKYKIKDIPLNSMVFIETVPEDPAEADEWYRKLKVGDVLTFRYVYATQVTITHRIVSIEEKETGGFIIELAGDNKNSDSDQLYQTIDTSSNPNMNYVIGKVTGKSYLIGAVMSFLMRPVGIVLVVIVPCFIIMMFEFVKIAKVLTADKKEKKKSEDEAREKELEELRNRLAELEKEKSEKTLSNTESPKVDEDNDSQGGES